MNLTLCRGTASALLFLLQVLNPNMQRSPTATYTPSFCSSRLTPRRLLQDACGGCSCRNNLPDSISILINFGTEKSHLLYDADQVFSQLYYVAFCMCISYVLAFVYMYFHLYLHLKLYLYLHLHLHEQANHACSCHQIWDPFSEMCHDIFCSTGQVNG